MAWTWIHTGFLLILNPYYKRACHCMNACSARETLIKSEFPQHMEVLPFSMADKPLKMKNNIKPH
jgi:hypothetical protein